MKKEEAEKELEIAEEKLKQDFTVLSAGKKVSILSDKESTHTFLLSEPKN